MGYNYHCFNEEDRSNCTQCSSTGAVQSNENAPFVCPHSQQPLKLMGETVFGSFGPKMTKEQIVADRKKRSRQHFKTDILPTIADSDAQAHHRKKLGYKK